MAVAEPVGYGEVAISYAKRGWHVLPVHGVLEVTAGLAEPARMVCACARRAACPRPAKHPHTAHGLKDASADQATVAAWWAKWPTANIGVVTGRGLLVVDVDASRGGPEALARLEAEHGALPPTLTCLTGGGGQHLWFSYDAAAIDVPCSVDVVAPGVDVRARGGYVVVPPSVHIAGTPYAWDVGQPDVAVQAPEWLVALCCQRRVGDTVGAGPVDAVVSGARNTHLCSIAGTLRRRGASQAVIFAALCAENVDKCRPPLDDSEVLRIARSVSRYEPSVAAMAGGEALSGDVGDAGAVGAVGVADGEGVERWWSELVTTADGAIKRSAGNAAVLLCNRPEWRGCLQYDEFADTIRWDRDAPGGGGPGMPRAGELLSDHHFGYIGHWLTRHCGPDFTLEAVVAAAVKAARLNTVHPVRDYLRSLTWDGTERLSTWLNVYLGSRNTEYEQAVGSWWMVSCVARVMEPGCQADHVLVFEGAQGVGKSSAVRTLAGKWYLGALPDLRGSDSAHALQGHWIIEVGELDAFRGQASSRVKDWVTQVVDNYRPSYGRCFVRRPRQCVFVGTTNEDDYLVDPTGGRRFWPVAVTRVRRHDLAADRDQLWAEAFDAYSRGEQWWPSDDMQPEIRAQAAARSPIDVWTSVVEDYCKNKNEVLASDIFTVAIRLPIDRVERRHEMRLGAVMRSLGWAPLRRMVARERVRMFVRGPALW